MSNICLAILAWDSFSNSTKETSNRFGIGRNSRKPVHFLKRSANWLDEQPFGIFWINNTLFGKRMSEPEIVGVTNEEKKLKMVLIKWIFKKKITWIVRS